MLQLLEVLFESSFWFRVTSKVHMVIIISFLYVVLFLFNLIVLLCSFFDGLI